MLVTDCVFIKHGEFGLRPGAWSEDEYRKKNIIIKNCRFVGDGIVLGGIDGGVLSGCIFEGPRVGRHAHVVIDSSYGELANSLVRDFVVANNRFLVGGTMCVIGGFQRAEDCWFVNNLFRDCVGWAIFSLAIAEPGVTLLRRRLHFIGNRFINCGSAIEMHAENSVYAENMADTLSGSFLVVRGSRSIIAHNWARNVQLIGIRLAEGVSRCTVIGNYLEDVSLAAFGMVG